VSGIQRIPEITGRPGKGMYQRLDRHHTIKIGHLHGSELHVGFRQSVQLNFCPASRSLVFSATRLRM